MLDAFDFFVVVFLFGTLSQQFHVSKAALVFSTTLTLATRPIGALIFGLLADRYGRRIPLMLNVIFFSIVEVACGFSPNFTFFLVMRTLFGIGMGGEWGVGASLAMEAAPQKWRGMLSGIVQSGYPGRLPARRGRRAIRAARVGLAMDVLARRRCPRCWRSISGRACRNRKPGSSIARPSTGAVLRMRRGEWKLFVYLVVLMVFMMFLSHGTQDLYPDFLGVVHHRSGTTVRLYRHVL